MASPSNERVRVVKGRIVTPDKVIDGGVVVIRGQDIVAVLEPADALPEYASAVPVVDVGRDYVMPGFVDIHNHGLGGCDEVMDHWQHPKFSLSRLLRCGTLSVIASVIFSSKRREAVNATIAKIEANVGKPVIAAASSAAADAAGGSATAVPAVSAAGAAAAVLEEAFAVGSVIEGIHAEGPIIEDTGGLPESDSSMPLPQFVELCERMPSMRIMTISPAAESRNEYARLKHLTKIGVRASLGHDKKATERAIVGALRVLSQAAEAKEGGTVDHTPHLTHVFNVMGFHHRQPGLVNFALCRDLPRHPHYEGITAIKAPTAEIIGDLIHVHPISVGALLSARSPADDVALISDCIAAYDPGRRLRYNGRQVMVRAEGGCYLIDPLGRPTTTLAGSTVTLADQLRTLTDVFKIGVVDACRMLATTPARIARVGDRVGSIAVGRKANLLVVSSGVEEITRRMVYGAWADDESHGPYRMLRPSVPSAL